MDRKGDFLEFFIGFGVFIIILVLLALISLPLIGIREIGTYEGTHTGYITSIEHRGNLVWESDILYFKTDSQSSQEDVYCIQQELLDKARDFQKNKTLVTISFKNDFIMWAWDCNGGSTIINNIQP